MGPSGEVDLENLNSLVSIMDSTQIPLGKLKCLLRESL